MKKPSASPSKKVDQGKIVQGVWASYSLPMFPRLDETALEAERLSDIRTSKFFSPLTAWAEAENNRRKAIDLCLGRVGARHRRALLELLEIDREFMRDPQVAYAFADWARSDRHWEQAGGRPRGHSRDTLDGRLGLTRVIEGLSRSTGLSPGKVMTMMARRGILPRSESLVKHVYYELRGHPAMQAHAFTHGGERVRLRVPRCVADRSFFYCAGIRISSSSPLPPAKGLRVDVVRGEAGRTELKLRLVLV